MNNLKKTSLFLIILLMLFLTACNNNTITKDKALNILSEKSNEELPDKYYYSILNDLKISNDIKNEYSKELAKYLYSKASFEVKDIKNNKVILNIKTKNIYSYLNDDIFLTEYIIKSNSFTEKNISLAEYNNNVFNFLKEKIDSKDVKYENFEYELNFTFNEKTGKYELSDSEYISFLDVVLCRNEEIEKQIAAKVEPLGFNKIEFIKNPIVAEEEKDIDNPRNKDYDLVNEKSLKNNTYLIPEDIEYKKIPEENETTRTSRRSAIRLRETAVFDGNGLDDKLNYKINILVNDVLFKDKAKEFLINNNESIDNSYNYIVFSVSIKLIENKTGNEQINFSFTDFDLVNYDNKTYHYLNTKNIDQFKSISKGETTTGYIVFKCNDNLDTLNLSFKEYLPNTLWFEIN